MRVLGLNDDMDIASAALVEDGRVIAAAAEERFTRQKRTRDFPANAVRYCLEEAGCTIDAIDAFACGWNPGVYFRKLNPLVSSRRRFKADQLYAVADHLMALHPESERRVDHVRQSIRRESGGDVDVYHVTHHRAHAANAFFLSAFEEAAVLTADSQGEVESTTLSIGRGDRIELLETLDYPHSLGAIYATFTEHLGFRPNSDEWKVMALASFGEAEGPYLDALRDEVIHLTPDGGFELDLRFFQGFLRDRPNLFTARFVERFGPPRLPGEELRDRHRALAAALQRAVEETTWHLLRGLHRRTGLTDLALGGGFFMNSVLNGRVVENTPFERVFISSCPDDSGNALGAALWATTTILGGPRPAPLTHNFLGPGYDDDVVARTLTTFGLAAERSADAAAEAAALVASGQVIGWFQGRMELGQRALGHRSILGDPRDAEMRDRVNRAVKFREGFRPFAPAVLAEVAADWFELPPEGVPFMEKVCPVRAAKREQIPAVCHVDGSARVQTVDGETNPRFHALIEAFRERTGVPIVLNTSFNLNGEPIVASPTDAIRTFFSCGLDALVLGDRILRKHP